MDIQKLSKQYTVRHLSPEDAAMVYEILRNHTIFYRYHPPLVTVESILDDMKALPPNKSYEDKHYIGFFQDTALLAVMDLIENYPRQKTAMIGFFAVNTDFQGRGLGSAILGEVLPVLARLGFEKARLGIDKGNPQSRAFWTKNGFQWTGEEYPNDFSSYLMMEQELQGFKEI